jgi:hypothetical protein
MALCLWQKKICRAFRIYSIFSLQNAPKGPLPADAPVGILARFAPKHLMIKSTYY